MATSVPGPPPSVDRTPVAPWWHTILFVVLILAFVLHDLYRPPILLGDRFQDHHLFLYAMQILFELTVLAYAWWGVRMAGGNLRNLIGGRWNSAKAVLKDVGVAFVLWLAVIAMLLTMHVILNDNTGGVRAVKAILPRSYTEIALWVAMSIVAAFCEEAIFRGYLQRQFLALTGRAEVAVVVQAILFGSVHLYQGVRGAITIAVYGILFGIVAVKVKSLRPGIIQHAAQDSVVGIVGGLLVKYNRI